MNIKTPVRSDTPSSTASRSTRPCGGSPLDRHRALLQALVYRMLGSAAEAEEIVQDTFVTALARPPVDTADLRPWLVRVACNLARDRLRHRKVRAVKRPWLPQPMSSPPMVSTDDPEAQLRLSQSATLAWLVAAEALTPEQRMVLLLRDVFDWEVDEVSGLLDRSAGAVRSLHLRARRTLRHADVPKPDTATLDRHRQALYRLFEVVEARDEQALKSLLDDDVVLVSDGAGEVHAVGQLLVGRERVARVILALAAASETIGVDEVCANAMPALLERYAPHRAERWPLRSLTSVEVNAEGRVMRVFNVVAPSKLGHIHLPDPSPARSSQRGTATGRAWV